MIIAINFRSSNMNYFIYTLQNSLLAKIFIEPIIIFREGPGAKLWSPILNVRLPTVPWRTWYMAREHAKQVLKTRYYFN